MHQPPRHILMTADTVGGVFSYAIELCRALGDAGVRVSLATMGASLTSRQREDLRVVGNVEVHESAFRLEWMDDPWADLERASQWLLELEAQVQPEIVHLNQFAFGALPFRAPRLVVGHSCVFSWFEAVKDASASPQFDRYRDVVQRGLRAADLVVAPSGAMLGALERHYGPLERSRVIYNARSPQQWQPRAKEPFVLAAGRLWDEAKNVSAVAQLAAELSWPVRLAGDTKSPLGGEFQSDGVTMLGLLSAQQLAEQMGAASIYAFPARYEPFGLSVLEAALSGCALVLGDIPSLRELWDGAALFVPPDNRAALKASIEALIQAPGRREQLATRARARAHHYSPAAMVRGYLDAYDALTSGRGS